MDSVIEKTKMLKVADIAKLLNISRGTVYRWSKSGRLPSVNLGAIGGRRCLRIQEQALEQLLNEAMQKVGAKE